MDAEWIVQAVDAIKNGLAEKLTKGDISVYKVGDNIRIDIKGGMQK